MRSSTSPAEDRPVTHPTSDASHTSPSDAARRPGAPRRQWTLPGAIARVSIEVSSASIRRISSATEASANMNARVIASVRCGSRCSARVCPAMTCITRAWGVPGHRGAAQPLTSASSNLRAEGAHEQVDLGGEVAVQGAQRDVGALGHGAHLHRLEAALRGELDGRVEDATSSLSLGGRSGVSHGQP